MHIIAKKHFGDSLDIVLVNLLSEAAPTVEGVVGIEYFIFGHS